MIRGGGHNLGAVRFGGKAVSAIKIGMLLVWQAVRSCFGAGYWSDASPWADDEGWKD